jgi:hypothetical protein
MTCPPTESLARRAPYGEVPPKCFSRARRGIIALGSVRLHPLDKRHDRPWPADGGSVRALQPTPNLGPADGVSQTSTPPPTTVLVTLAAPGRNPTDITLPTVGSEGAGGGERDDAMPAGTSASVTAVAELAPTDGGACGSHEVSMNQTPSRKAASAAVASDTIPRRPVIQGMTPSDNTPEPEKTQSDVQGNLPLYLFGCTMVTGGLFRVPLGIIFVSKGFDEMQAGLSGGETLV